ncbi:unannotated protein [freshwater metagenome]|uniref:Unannotated protein n=1 Tax=freshwater metagenome TaxID=449393 RepID=A0A6J7A9M8_9ZZZZ|nr:Bsp6I family restriction endonuclease [Actinomycetota bacterium]
MTVKVDWVNATLLHEAYWHYRIIATTVPWAKRAPNMPSELTEAIVCLCTGAELIDEGHGDILLPKGLIGEVKGTSSSDGDLSSFSPSSEFDKLYFVHMDPQTHDIYHVYDLGLNRKSIARIKVNNTSTFADHAKGNRRPRFSIIDQIIRPGGLKPTWKVDMSKRAII